MPGVDVECLRSDEKRTARVGCPNLSALVNTHPPNPYLADCRPRLDRSFRRPAHDILADILRGRFDPEPHPQAPELQEVGAEGDGGGGGGDGIDIGAVQLVDKGRERFLQAVQQR